MMFFVRRMKFSLCWLQHSVKNNFGSKLQVNLNSGNINNWKNYNTRSGVILPEKSIKKYLKSITVAYKAGQKVDDELKLIIEVRKVITLLEDCIQIEENIKSLEELGQQDEEIKKSSQEELAAYKSSLNNVEEELLDVIVENLGRDNCRDIIFEITAGVGGQEAMLFTADLFNMYQGHFEHLGFTYEVIDMDAESGIGGIRHLSFLVSGERAFELLRHEGGVHRVQRIPSTEKSGRMHTSTATVAVLPQPSQIEVNLHEKDLKIETKKSSGPGGQSVNKTDSAVRIVHIPTGIAVEAQSERSQIKNKRIALIKLRAKIYELELNEMKMSTGSLRKKQRGLSQRNEKIRTYNYNQDRITDHRLSNGTMHNLKGFMEGGEDLENLQERLQRDLQLKLFQEIINKYK